MLSLIFCFYNKISQPQDRKVLFQIIKKCFHHWALRMNFMQDYSKFFSRDDSERKQLCLGILWPSCSHEFKLISFSITKVWLSIGFDVYCLAKTLWHKTILDAYIYSLKPCLCPFIFSCVSIKDCSLFLKVMLNAN